MKVLAELDPSPRFPRTGLSKILERGLWTFSLICLAIFVWMKMDAWRFQREASASWSQTIASKAAPGESPRVGSGRVRSGVARAATPPLPRLEPGTPIARLTIARLDLEVVVAEGTSNAVLQKAVGHLEGTARPGADGNVVLAGHRDTFFRPLESVRPGDRIELDGGAGNRTYIVEWAKVVPPDHVEVAAPTPEPALTLITCYPFRYIGPAPERFIVRARALREEDSKGVSPPRARGAGG